MDTSEWVRKQEPRRSLSRTNSMTNSIKSSISAIKHNATRYRKYVIISSILLMVSSCGIIFYSLVLINWYLMPNLVFWDEQFYNAPYFLLALGIFKLIIAMYGFAINRFKNRCLLAVFSLLLIVAFIMQLASIGFFWNVRTTILVGEVSGLKITGMLKNYGNDPHVTESLDYMQQHLSCCGGNEWQTGYIDYKYSSYGIKHNGVPDSCCVDKRVGCGRDIYSRGNEREIAKRIYVNGCVGILRKWMEEDILPMIWTYTFIGIGIALCDVLFVVLVCAYIAQISRRYLKIEDKNFVNIVQYGMFGDKGIHYPKLPDVNFMGVKVEKKKAEKKGKNKFPWSHKSVLGHEWRNKKYLHKEDDINESVSQFLSHGMSTETFQCSNVESVTKSIESEAKVAAPEPIYEKIQKVGIKDSKVHKKATLPACKIQVETYSTEPKLLHRTLNLKPPITKTSSDPISSTSAKKVSSDESDNVNKTGRGENKVANLRKAWIRDNMTLHKHPSALESGSLGNVTTNPIPEPVSREVRSLTPEKPQKPVRVKVSAFNTTHKSSLETKL